MKSKQCGSFIAISVLFLFIMGMNSIHYIKEDYIKVKNNRKVDMKLKEIEEKILKKDWDALDILDTMESKEQAIPVLSKLLKNNDSEVREISIKCLSLINNTGTLKIIATALNDEDKEVRTSAMQSIQSIYNASILNELIDNLNNSDESIREGVALLIGRIGIDASKNPLYKRLEIEKEEQVRRAIQLSLAKLGDKNMKEIFVTQFDIPDSGTRLRALEDMKYINDKNLAKKIMPALDDYGNGYLISHKTEPVPRYARVCDAAITLIAYLFNNPFTFEVSEMKKYNAEEILEAQKFLKSLGND